MHVFLTYLALHRMALLPTHWRPCCRNHDCRPPFQRTFSSIGLLVFESSAIIIITPCIQRKKVPVFVSACLGRGHGGRAFLSTISRSERPPLLAYALLTFSHLTAFASKGRAQCNGKKASQFEKPSTLSQPSRDIHQPASASSSSFIAVILIGKGKGRERERAKPHLTSASPAAFLHSPLSIVAPPRLPNPSTPYIAPYPPAISLVATYYCALEHLTGPV